MLLKQIILQYFRSYSQADFAFSPHTTIIMGPNTAGKTNLMEAIWLLSTGKSFRIEKDMHMMQFGKEVLRVKGLIEEELADANETEEQKKEILEVMVANGEATSGRFIKRYLLNDIPKRRADFAGHLPAVLFSPEELDIVSGSPSLRRQLLDDVLEQVDREYRRAILLYEKSLRQRNALLNIARETGKRNSEQFSYWDEILIHNGDYITQKRALFLDFINEEAKDIFTITIQYDKSVISEERLLEYRDAEMGSGVTLVGPHRDDFFVFHDEKEIKYFGSRGQQRLAVLQLKILQMKFIELTIHQKPLLLLDDIFSELDSQHMELVLSRIGSHQTIMTTTHKEFINEKGLREAKIIELK